MTSVGFAMTLPTLRTGSATKMTKTFHKEKPDKNKKADVIFIQ